MPVVLNPDDFDLSRWIRSGDTVIWGQANAEPLPLTQALMAQRARIGRFRVFLGIANHPTCTPAHADHVDFIAYIGTGANRELDKAGGLEVLPCHYSQLPELIRSGALRIDVVLLQVAPANAEGRYSLSMAHEYLLPALDSARVVIAEVNRQAPWTYGERTLGADDFDALLETDRPPLESPVSQLRPLDRQIGAHIAGLVEDGSTVQIGIGAIPDAALAALGSHRDLGVHSGVISDGVMELMRSGVVNNSRKSIDRGLSVGGVLIGSRALNDFVHQNPAILMRSSEYTHAADVLSGIERFVSINSAIEVDLTGQVNSEVVGGTYVGAVGGALDFTKGAQRSHGGVPIIALPSTAGSNSRIVARMSGPVTIPRSEAGVIVTEFGVADLRGLTLRERARKMLEIAHPDHRARLEEEFFAMR
ncbi:Butanoate coenzyme A-transferase [compost metagenome]